MYVACLKDLVNKTYVGKKFVGSNMNTLLHSYRYLRHPPVIKEVSLRGGDCGDMTLTLGFENDESGNRVMSYRADIEEDIKLED